MEIKSLIFFTVFFILSCKSQSDNEIENYESLKVTMKQSLELSEFSNIFLFDFHKKGVRQLVERYSSIQEPKRIVKIDGLTHEFVSENCRIIDSTDIKVIDSTWFLLFEEIPDTIVDYHPRLEQEMDKRGLRRRDLEYSLVSDMFYIDNKYIVFFKFEKFRLDSLIKVMVVLTKDKEGWKTLEIVRI